MSWTTACLKNFLDIHEDVSHSSSDPSSTGVYPIHNWVISSGFVQKSSKIDSPKSKSTDESSLSLIQIAGNPPSHIEVPPAAHQASPWRLRPLRPLRPSRNAGRGRLGRGGRGCGCLPPQSHRQRQPGAGA